MLFVYSCVVVLDTNSHRYGVPLKIIVWGKKEKAMFDILQEACLRINIANGIYRYLQIHADTYPAYPMKFRGIDPYIHICIYCLHIHT